MFIIIPYINSLQFADSKTVILSWVLLAKELNLESAKKIGNYSAPRTQHTHIIHSWPKFKIVLIKKLGWKFYYCQSFWSCDQKTWMVVIHYLENKVGVVDFANAQGMVMF